MLKEWLFGASVHASDYISLLDPDLRSPDTTNEEQGVGGTTGGISEWTTEMILLFASPLMEFAPSVLLLFLFGCW